MTAIHRACNARIEVRRAGARVLSTALCVLSATALSAAAEDARIVVDAGRVEARIDPRLYGQFLELMFEGVKGGLSAELLRDRGFEEPPSAIGLSRRWERYPDDRIDDYGLNFAWDDSVAYPIRFEHFDAKPVSHSLRVDVKSAMVERHGFYQPRVPVRAGIGYSGYL